MRRRPPILLGARWKASGGSTACQLLSFPLLSGHRFDVDVRLGAEVTAIDRAAKSITVKDVASGAESQHVYDALVLSPGANAIRPALPGIDLPGIFQLKTIPDTCEDGAGSAGAPLSGPHPGRLRRWHSFILPHAAPGRLVCRRNVKQWIASMGARRAVVVGGGFIGLELAENLVSCCRQSFAAPLAPCSGVHAGRRSLPQPRWAWRICTLERMLAPLALNFRCTWASRRTLWRWGRR